MKKMYLQIFLAVAKLNLLHLNAVRTLKAHLINIQSFQDMHLVNFTIIISNTETESIKLNGKVFLIIIKKINCQRATAS